MLRVKNTVVPTTSKPQSIVGFVMSWKKGSKRDSFAHCFFECNYVKNLINVIISRTRFNFDLNGITDDNGIKKLYWYGIYGSDNLTPSTNYCYLFFFDSLRYILFRHRVKRRLLSIVDFFAEFVYFLQCIFGSNKKLEQLFFRTYELANFLQASG
jgi:hypothetical protein